MPARSGAFSTRRESRDLCDAHCIATNRHYRDLEANGRVVPWPEVQSEVVQSAASFHNLVSKPFLPAPDLVFNNSIPFHTPYGMLDPNPNLGNESIVFRVFWSQFFASRFLSGLNDDHTCDGEPLKACILEQDAALRKGIACFIRSLFVMLLAFAGGGEETDLALRVDDDDVFDRMLFLLATIVLFLKLLVLGARNGPFRAIMKVDGQFRFFRDEGCCVSHGQFAQGGQCLIEEWM